MPRYNLDALGHERFESLCQALLQQIIGHGVKVFGMGSDGSREATFSGKAPYPSATEQWDGRWIFQAKFHDTQQIGHKRARTILLSELDEELAKITEKYEYPCDNYILMTNVSLTPAFQKGTKDRIANEIVPKYRRKIENIDVVGAEEICCFLDNHPNIRQAYIDLLVAGDITACLLGYVGSKKADLEELVRLYCQGSFIHEQSAALDDAGDIEDKPVALHRVFIDLDVKPQACPPDPEILERSQIWLKEAAEDEDRTSALSYLLDDSILNSVLIGGPGEGKSTLGQYIAQIHRARLIGKLSEVCENYKALEECEARVPFRVFLREYAQWITSRSNSDSLFHYIATLVSRESGRDAGPETIHEIVKSNPILLILDGLDEVSEKKLRRRVLENITSFADQIRDVLRGDLKIVASTRPYGYSREFDPSHYLHLTLQKLSSEKALIYSELWIKNRELDTREAERISSTIDTCVKDKVVCFLLQTPLQVTILLVIIRARGTPPKQREELFERYADIIYQREQKKRPELLRTEFDTIYGLHQYLAYILHRRAGEDKTAALMDMNDFRQKISEYLVHGNPLLTGSDLEAKVNQIITEASQRLVLIESPQEGKVGFGLAGTREFFAAAHLVDTARNTKERDLRFKAIVRCPHWRNVALFFAGRVGRTRPGEVASMIDVCREIDTEGIDKCVRRGAEFVVDMVDDRDLREPHNEIGAIQYGLSLFDRRFAEDPERYATKLKGLPEQYKERIIRPWFEERLRSADVESIDVYADVYSCIFGFGDPLLAAIKRGANLGSDEIRLWALSKSLEHKVVEPWVIELLEDMVEIFPLDELSRALEEHWQNFEHYLAFPLSESSRRGLAVALNRGVRYRIPPFGTPFGPVPPQLLDDLSRIDPTGKPRENFLYLWAQCQLMRMSALSSGRKGRPALWPISALPSFSNPAVSAVIGENAGYFKEFCETFCKDGNELSKVLTALFDFLLDPDDFSKYVRLSKQFHEAKELNYLPRVEISVILGSLPRNENELRESHNGLLALRRCCSSEERYREVSERLHGILRRQSEKVPTHANKICLWTYSGFDTEIRKSLDSDIMDKVEVMLGTWKLPLSVLRLYWVVYFTRRIELRDLELYFDALEKRIAEGLNVTELMPFWINDYEWSKPHTDRESDLCGRIRNILERLLSDYSNADSSADDNIEVLYAISLGANVINETHLMKIYEIARKNKDFASSYFFSEFVSKESIEGMLKSESEGVVRMAALTLSSMLNWQVKYIDPKNRVEGWIGDKFWELAKNRGDIWHTKYIEGMARCKLKWAENHREWFEDLTKADSIDLQKAWSQVIRRAGYCDDQDRDTLANLLVSILESRGTFPRSIRIAASSRLLELVQEMEPAAFEEESLGLPLALRLGLRLPS
jgi:hypothetical protein